MDLEHLFIIKKKGIYEYVCSGRGCFSLSLFLSFVSLLCFSLCTPPVSFSEHDSIERVLTSMNDFSIP